MHGMKVARQFASTPAMRARLASDTEVPDSTIKHPPTSDDYLRCVEARARPEGGGVDGGG